MQPIIDRVVFKPRAFLKSVGQTLPLCFEKQLSITGPVIPGSRPQIAVVGHLPTCKPRLWVYALRDRGTTFIKAACVVVGEARPIGGPAIRIPRRLIEKFASASDTLERVHFGAHFRKEADEKADRSPTEPPTVLCWKKCRISLRSFGNSQRVFYGTIRKHSDILAAALHLGLPPFFALRMEYTNSLISLRCSLVRSCCCWRSRSKVMSS